MLSAKQVRELRSHLTAAQSYVADLLVALEDIPGMTTRTPAVRALSDLSPLLQTVREALDP